MQTALQRSSAVTGSLGSVSTARARTQAFVASARPICRPVLPARPWHVHAYAAVSQTGHKVTTAPESAQAVVQPSPVAAPAAAPSLQEKLSKLVRSTAKAAAILGVAVALVSVDSKICA
jgi:hypothetical protein